MRKKNRNSPKFNGFPNTTKTGGLAVYPTQSPSAAEDEPKPLRILFLNPPNPGVSLWPQTRLASLAAMIEGEGHTARIIDAVACPQTPEELEKECHEWKPDLIIIQSETSTIRNDTALLAQLGRATAAICGLMGPHASALPVETLRESAADFILNDEAEEMIAELIWSLARLARTHRGVGTQHTAEDVRQAMSKIDGLVWRMPGQGAPSEDGLPDAFSEILVNRPRKRIANLDELLPPARHLLPNHAYRLPFFGKHPFATIIVTRGCSRQCSFCQTGAMWGQTIRFRSVESVLEELEYLQSALNIRRFVFLGDALTSNRDWALELFSRMARLHRRPTWICNSHVATVDVKLLRLMKLAGCQMISYGLESGVQSILDGCQKGITLDQSEKAILQTRQADILTRATFQFGLPGETAGTAHETIRFARRINPDYASFNLAVPFPGTRLYEQALQNGWLTSQNWDLYRPEGPGVLQAGELTPSQLCRIRARAIRLFYLRPGIFMRELTRIRSWSGFFQKARAGIQVFNALEHE
jgi:radical SAM superfamily enzyme YgiQ (UPF0313 family)